MQQYISEMEALGFSYKDQQEQYAPSPFPASVLEGLKKQAAASAKEMGKKKAFIRQEPFENARIFEKEFSSEAEAAKYWTDHLDQVKDFNRFLSQRVSKFVQSDPEVKEENGKWILRVNVFLGGPKIVLE